MERPKSQIPNPNRLPKQAARTSDPKPYDLRERSLLFAIRMLKVAAMLPVNSEAKIIRRQIARAGTSIGANIEEADGAVSRPDKRRSFTIARKETRETRYWLRIIQHLWSPGENVDADIVEASKLLNILSAIISKLE
jgi:four helix bundle protein